MQRTWRRRTTVGGLVLVLGLPMALAIAAAPQKGIADRIERQTPERTSYDDMGRAERGSREFPTPGAATGTREVEGVVGFGPSTDGGGAFIPGLGTVSHANIDNNWARLEDQIRTGVEPVGGSGSWLRRSG